MRANIWQGLPGLNVARQNASGMTLGDYLYVFGGSGGCNSIERLNIKLDMQRTGEKFVLLDIKLPTAASDIGFVPSLSPQETLLVGGFGADGRSMNQLLKFSARPTGNTEGSQD